MVGAVVSPAPAASATWNEQRLPSPNALGIDQPSLAANARGDTAVAWRAGARSFLAVRRAGAARFGRKIELRRFSSPRVAVLSDGTVLVATLRNDGTEVGRRPCCAAVYVQRLRPRGRRLSVASIVTTRGAPTLELGLSLVSGPGGRAALIGAGDDGITVVTSRGGGQFGAPVSVSPRFGSETFIGFGGDGRGAALWVEGSNQAQRLVGARIGADGGVGAASTYAEAPDPLSDFSFFGLGAGVDRRSRLTALWVSTGRLGSATPPSLSVATGSVDGPLGHRQVLDERPGIGNGIAAAQLAVAPDGRAVASWRTYGGGAGEQTLVAIRSGAAARFRVLPALGATPYGPRVAVLPGGPAIVVSGAGPNATAARIVRFDGRLAGRRVLRGAPRTLGIGSVAARGRITLAWGASDGLHTATFTAPR